MMLPFYDRQGHPMTLEDWAVSFDRENRHVASTSIGDWWVSTVFLGMDAGFANPVPLIFETMIFQGGSATDLYTDRYPTQDAALAGHDQAVAFLKQRLGEIHTLTGDSDEPAR